MRTLLWNKLTGLPGARDFLYSSCYRYWEKIRLCVSNALKKTHIQGCFVKKQIPVPRRGINCQWVAFSNYLHGKAVKFLF